MTDIFKDYSLEDLKELKRLKELYDLAREKSSIEQALKIILNSLYGAISNVNFQWYNLDIASAITLTGQMYIRSVIFGVNTDFNSKFKSINRDHVPGADTDSAMIEITNIVNTYYKGEKDKHKICDWILELDNTYLGPLIDNINNNVSTYLNAYQPNVMNMKREVVSDKSLFLAKKRYCMSVLDKEGVRYHKDKLKIQGLEIVRSTTPKIIQDYLREAVPIIFHGTEKDVKDYCFKIEEGFRDTDIVSIASLSGTSDIDKWVDEKLIYKSGTPQHIRAAILYNHILERDNLDKVIEPIKSGDKIKYLPLIVPNPIVGMKNVLAFQGDTLPDFLVEKYNIYDYINYKELFNKNFKKPLTNMIEPLNYNLDLKVTLDDLFG